MFREKITKHAEWVAGMLEGHPDIASIEDRTKGSLIEPLLRCLGYDPYHPGQVEREAVIRGKKVDYMLTGEKGAKVAVEAKSAKTTLSEKEIDQLDAYFHHSEAVAGVLTNGVDCWLFTDLGRTNVMDSKPYRKVNIHRLSQNDIDHLERLTRSRVSQSTVHEQAQREQYMALVNEIVAHELASPSPEFLKLVGRKVGIKPLTKTNLAFLTPLVAEATSRYRGAPQPVDPKPESSILESPTKMPADGPDAQTKLTPGKRAALTRRQFRGASLFGEDLSVDSYKEMLIAVVRQMRAGHPETFTHTVQNPALFRGRKYWAISKDPDELNPHNPKGDTHLVGDFYVDVSLSAKDKNRRAHQFQRAFDHDASELIIRTSTDLDTLS